MSVHGEKYIQVNVTRFNHKLQVYISANHHPIYLRGYHPNKFNILSKNIKLKQKFDLLTT